MRDSVGLAPTSLAAEYLGPSPTRDTHKIACLVSIPVLGLQCADPSPRPVVAHMCAQLADVFWCAGQYDAG